MAAKHQSAYRRGLAEKGRQEITVVVSNITADVLRQVAKDHGQTQGRVLELGLAAAKQMLDQRLDPTTPTSRAKPALIVARKEPQERAVSLQSAAADAVPLPEQERSPPVQQREPNDVDARIRAAATSCFTVVT